MILSIFFTTSASAKIKVAVTIDDLPVHSSMPSHTNRIEIVKKMLSKLKEYRVPEVYGFINAKKIETDPDTEKVLQLWVESGYPLGNHTYSHPDIGNRSVDEYEKDILDNETELQRLSINSNWKYFRYPYLREGETLEKRNAIRTFLQIQNYKIAQVTIDFEDWSWNDPYARCLDQKDTKAVRFLIKSYLKNSVDQLQRADIVSQALFKRSIPHILLLHIGAFDAQMIGELLKAYQHQGVEFIGLSEALDDEIYTIDPQVVGKYGSEFTYQVLKSRNLTLRDVGLQPYNDYPEKQLDVLCK